MIIVRIFFTLLILGPILLGIRNLIKNKNLSTPKKITAHKTLINSAILYALAYNIIFFLQELFLVLGKKALGLKSFLYHNNHSWEGTHEMASLMQGSGALAIFAIGLLCLIWFNAIRKSWSVMKLLILWLAFHGLIQSIPQVMVAFFEKNTDVGQALVGYLDIPNSLLIFLAVLSIIATAVTSIWFVKPLLEFAPDDMDIECPKVRLSYIRYIAVGGAFLGCIFTVPFRILPLSQVIAPFLLFLFSIPWIWSMASVIRANDPIPNSLNTKIHWQYIWILLSLLLIFRFVLAPGISF